MDTSERASQLAALSLDRKAAITAGHDVWTVPGIPELGIPPLRMTDGPNGARGSVFGGAVRSICVPCGSALAATFDPDLVERIGALLGREARQKRARVLLAPTINLVRSPLYGRAFECYGEDPWLSGRLAAAFVKGVQSEGVATTPKHLIGNEAEYQRHTINSVIDERTLREVYLVPFEWAVRHGGALGLMTSYNRLNGNYCSEDASLLTGIVRDEWGFEGFVVSDWFAAGSTVGSLQAGLDVQMPGPDRFFGAPVARAVAAGEVSEAYLDEIVRRRIHLHEALGAWDDDTTQPEAGVEHDDDRALAREAAAAAMVLLENDGLLPLDRHVGSIALIGPNADAAHIMGGGSAQLAAHRRVSPAAAFRARLGDRVVVERGCVIDKLAPPLRAEGGFAVDFFANEAWSGTPVAQTTQGNGRAIWIGEPAEGLGTDPFSARLAGTISIGESGEHVFTLIQAGRARVSIDGAVVLDGITDPPPMGDAFFGMGSIELEARVHLEAGQRVEVVIELVAGAGTGVRGVSVGHRPPVPADLFGRAVRAALDAEVAIVVVGTSNEWETEGSDRSSIDLPGDQVALIEAVCEANPRTVVVVNAGAPVDMSWSELPAAVLVSWLGGQEMAEALVDVIMGDADPGGRLPVSLPIAIEHTPAFGNFPGESNQTRYGEGLLVGYRWYDSRRLPVAYPFGHGLSYTTVDWTDPAIDRIGPATCTVSITVTNVGLRAGSEVVQVYVGHRGSRLFRPDRQLVGAAKVWLEVDCSERITITLNERSFAQWDPANDEHVRVRAKLAGTAEGIPGARHGAVTQPGWYVDSGVYDIVVARSSGEAVHELEFVVESPVGPLAGEQSLP